MEAYPTLSVFPTYPIRETPEDSTLKSDFEAGYILTRAKFTRSRKSFYVSYQNMPNADKEILDTFGTTVNGGSDSFTWTHPMSSVSYIVRFDKRPAFEGVGYSPDIGFMWNTEFTLVQV